MLRYPPYSHLLRVGLSSESEERLDAAAAAIAAELRSAPPGRLRAARAGADVPGARTAPRAGPGQGRRSRGDGRRGAGEVERRAADRALKDVSIGVDIDPQ